MRLSFKLSLASLLLAVLSISATSTAALYISASQSSDAAVAKLETLADGRRNELAQYLRSIKEDLRSFSREKVVGKTLSDLSDAFNAIPGDRAADLQRRYIDDNPAPDGQKSDMKTAGRDDYDKFHGRYHGFFQRFAEEKGYRDILLADLSGNVVYSLQKHRDFAANLTSGALKETGLGQVFAAAAPGTDTSIISFADYQVHAPSGAPAAFVAIPLASVAGKIGVLVFQMPDARIASILNNKVGLGDTGEAILLNSDGQFLTDSLRSSG